ncbi:MAG: ABC transporter ATP-binding protein, partial [Phototrophicales bacterium]
LQIADYAHVLERGQIAHSGRAESLRQTREIIAAYLG